MAITNEQLTFKLGIDANNLSDTITELNAKTIKLSSSTDDLQDNMEVMSKTQKEYALAVDKATSSLTTQVKEYNEVASSLNNLKVNFESIKEAIPEKEMSSFAEILVSMTETMSALIRIAEILGAIFSSLADPGFIKRLDRVLFYLQTIASLKGFSFLASSISFLRDRIHALHSDIVLLQRVIDYIRFPDEKVYSFNESLEDLNRTIENTRTTANYGHQAFTLMADPATAKQLDNILIIMQAIADIKGFPSLADKIYKVRVEASKLLDQLKRFSDGDLISIPNLAKNAQDYYEFMDILDDVIGTLESFAAVYAVRFIENLFKIDASEILRKLAIDIDTELGQSLESILKTLVKYGKYINNVGIKNAIRFQFINAIEELPAVTNLFKKALTDSQIAISNRLYKWGVEFSRSSGPSKYAVADWLDSLVLITIPKIKGTFYQLSKTFAGTIAVTSTGLMAEIIFGLEELVPSIHSAITNIIKPVVGGIAISLIGINNGIRAVFPYKEIASSFIYGFDKTFLLVGNSVGALTKNILPKKAVKEFIYTFEEFGNVIDLGGTYVAREVHDVGSKLEFGYSKWKDLGSQAINNILLNFRHFVLQIPIYTQRALTDMAKFIIKFRFEINALFDIWVGIDLIFSENPFLKAIGYYILFNAALRLVLIKYSETLSAISSSLIDIIVEALDQTQQAFFKILDLVNKGTDRILDLMEDFKVRLGKVITSLGATWADLKSIFPYKNIADNIIFSIEKSFQLIGRFLKSISIAAFGKPIVTEFIYTFDEIGAVIDVGGKYIEREMEQTSKALEFGFSRWKQVVSIGINTVLIRLKDFTQYFLVGNRRLVNNIVNDIFDLGLGIVGAYNELHKISMSQLRFLLNDIVNDVVLSGKEILSALMFFGKKIRVEGNALVGPIGEYLLHLVLNLADFAVKIKNTLFGLASVITPAFSSIVTGFQQGTLTLSGVLKSSFIKMFDFISPILTAVGSQISSGLGALNAAFNSTNKSFFDLFVTTFSKGYNSVKNLSILTGSLGTTIRELGNILPKSALGLIAEFGNTAGSAFGFLGIKLIESDSLVYKLIGTLTIGLSIALGGLGTLISLFANSIGHLAYNIGSVLADSMREYTKEANKADLVTSQFEFTVRGFNKTLGAESTGTIEQWNEVITNAMDSSSLSITQLQKSIKILIAEGAAINLDFAGTTDILASSMELATQNSEELVNVVTTVVKAVAGINNVGLINLGVNLSDATLAHSDYGIAIGKTVEQMTKEELLAGRLYELHKQTIPILGSTTNELTTMEGKTKDLNSELERLRILFGESGYFSILFTSIILRLTKAITSIPKSILSSIASLIDFLAIFLQISGVLITFSLTIIGVISLIKVLNVLIVSSTTLQYLLNTAFIFLNRTIQVQIVEVTTLSAVWLNFRNILASGLLASVRILGVYVLIATNALVAMAVAAAPLLAKFAAIAFVLFAVTQAVQELYAETFQANKEMEKQGGILESIGEAWDTVKQKFKSAFVFLTQGIKALIVGGIGLALVIRKLYLEFQRFYQFDGERFSGEIDKIDKSIAELSLKIEDSAVKMLVAFDEGITSGRAFGEAVKKSTREIELLILRQKTLSKINESIDKDSIRIDVLGQEYSKLTNKLLLAKNSVALLSKEFLEGNENSKESLEKYKDALDSLYRSEFELDKFRIESVNGISKIMKQLNSDNLRLQTDETASIVESFNEKRDAVREFEIALANTGTVSGEAAQKIIDAYALINKSQSLAIKLAKEKKAEEANKEAIRIYKEQAEALDEINKLNAESMKIISGTDSSEREKIKSDLVIELGLIEKKLEILRATWGVETEMGRALMARKKLLEGVAAVKTTDATLTLLDNWNDLNAAIKRAFSIETVKNFVDFIVEKFEEINKNGIVIKVKQVVTEAVTSAGAMANEAVSAVAGIGGGAVGEVAAKAGEVIAAGADVAMEAGKTLLAGIAKAGGWIGAIVDVIMNADKYLQILLDMPKMILGVLEKLPGMMLEVAKTFPEMITKIAEALPGILIQIVNAIPSLIEGLLSALPVLIERLAEAFPEIFIKLVSMIPKIVVMLIKAFAKGIQSYVKGLIRGIGNLLSGKKIKLPEIKVATKTLKEVKRIAGDTSKLFSVKDLADQVRSPMKDLTDGIDSSFDLGNKKTLNTWQKIGATLTHWSDQIEKVFTDAWNEILHAFGAVGEAIGNIFKAIFKAFTDIFDEVARFLNAVLGTIAKAILDVVAALIKGISDIWEGVKDLVGYIWQAFVEIWAVLGDIFDTIIKGVEDVFVAVIKAFSDMWEGMKQIFAYVVQAFSELWEVAKEAFATIVKAIGDVFTAAVKAIKDTFDTVVKAFSDLWEGVKNLFGNIVQGFKDVWNELKEGFSKIWEGFKNIVGNAFKPITDFFKGFKLPDFSFPSLPNFSFPSLPSFSWPDLPRWNWPELPKLKIEMPGGGGGGGGDLGKAWESIKSFFSAGGPVYAASGLMIPRGTDTVPAMLSPGEFIMSRKGVETNGIGLLQQMNAGNKMQSSGPVTYNIEFNIKVDAKTTMDESFIKNNLIPKMRENLKRASLDGEFVMSSKGVRS